MKDREGEIRKILGNTTSAWYVKVLEDTQDRIVFDMNWLLHVGQLNKIGKHFKTGSIIVKSVDKDVTRVAILHDGMLS